jgi:hypothetical protein
MAQRVSTRVPQSPRFPQNIEGISAKKIVNSIHKNDEIPRKISNIPRNIVGIFIWQLAILQ